MIFIRLLFSIVFSTFIFSIWTISAFSNPESFALKFRQDEKCLLIGEILGPKYWRIDISVNFQGLSAGLTTLLQIEPDLKIFETPAKHSDSLLFAADALWTGSQASLIQKFLFKILKRSTGISHTKRITRLAVFLTGIVTGVLHSARHSPSDIETSVLNELRGLQEIGRMRKYIEEVLQQSSNNIEGKECDKKEWEEIPITEINARMLAKILS